MWDYILAGLIGAAIPLITLWLQSKEKRKYFELERKEKLKMVAIDKRLETHQQALKQWYSLKAVIHASDDDPHKTKILEAARDFWYSNSLYLEKQTRAKFQEAFGIVSNYKMWLEMGHEMQPGKEKDKHTKFYLGYWDEFHNLFEIIQKEVELEPIKPEEDKTPEGEPVNKEIEKR
jgi:hypothetical protein